MNKGISLIETLVYIALLSLLTVGIISSIYVLINSENKKSLRQGDSDTALLLEKYH